MNGIFALTIIVICLVLCVCFAAVVAYLTYESSRGGSGGCTRDQDCNGGYICDATGVCTPNTGGGGGGGGSGGAGGGGGSGGAGGGGGSGGAVDYSDCVNNNVDCLYWASMGRCDDPDFPNVSTDCVLSCSPHCDNVCADERPDCQYRAPSQCDDSNFPDIAVTCRQSCGFCT